MSGISKLWKTPGKEKQRRREANEMAAIKSQDYTGIDPASHTGTNWYTRGGSGTQRKKGALGSVRHALGSNK